MLMVVPEQLLGCRVDGLDRSLCVEDDQRAWNRLVDIAEIVVGRLQLLLRDKDFPRLLLDLLLEDFDLFLRARGLLRQSLIAHCLLPRGLV